MPDINQLLDDVERFQKRIAVLEKQLAGTMTGKAVEFQEVDSGTIRVESIVSHRTVEPLVVIRWGLQVAQLQVEEARAHALIILECADGAESDAFLVHFLQDKVNLPPEKYGPILMEFREYREQRRNQPKEPS